MTLRFSLIQLLLLLLTLIAGLFMFGSILLYRSLFYFNVFGSASLLLLGLFGLYTGFTSRHQKQISAMQKMWFGPNILWFSFVVFMFGFISLLLRFF
jgi:hypothetical protein